MIRQWNRSDVPDSIVGWFPARRRRLLDVRLNLLACLRHGPLLARRLHSLQRELQPLPPELGACDDLLNILEHMWIANLLPQLFEEGMNLCEHEEHFPAHSRLDEQLFVQRPLQDE